jgi:hypothetical protein
MKRKKKKKKDSVVIEGVEFRSFVLVRNLSDIRRVFPFVLTLGPQIDEILDHTSDILDKYLLDEIANVALRKSRNNLKSHISDRYAVDKISYMSPGSLDDWPIEEQKKLFLLLNNVESSIGVELTDTLLMVPRKSVSGLFFQSESTFFSCQLCPRKGCDSRKGPFDKKKAIDYGLLE